ncbi:hypothetical protein E2C11_16715 [Streptomyces lavendulae]|nr:hypothetical protein [Streptomyces lavendulae]TXJ77896.1 hypothetical protein E2C11_16715 [Streptomyces lavendulae]
MHSYRLAPGNWEDIQFTQEWDDEAGDHAADGETFAAGAARFIGSLPLHFEGLPVGDVVQVRMSESGGDAPEAVHPIHEVIGAPGGMYGFVSLVKRIGAGRSMRVRLLDQSKFDIEVASTVLTALTWKES